MLPRALPPFPPATDMRLPFAVRTGMSWGWVPRQARHFQMQEGILNHIEYLPFHSPLPPPQPYYCNCTSTTASDFCHVSHSNIFSPSASMTGRLPRHGSCGITLAMCRRPAPQFRRAKTIRRANKIHDALPPRFCRCRCRFRPLPTGKGPAHVLNTASDRCSGKTRLRTSVTQLNLTCLRRYGIRWSSTRLPAQLLRLPLPLGPST
jgi:hypothetical protein